MKNSFQFLTYAGYKIVTSTGYRIYVDPFLDDNPAAPYKTDAIDGCEMVIVTHGAYDHVGDTAKIAKRFNSWVICNDDVKFQLLEQGVAPDKITSTAWGLSIEVDNLIVKPVENHHRSTIVLPSGRIVSSLPHAYIVYLEDGTRVYIAGDTALFSDMKLQGELYAPHIGLINAVTDWIERTEDYSRPHIIAGEMSPYEASLCAKWLGLDVVLPCHYISTKNPQLKEFVDIMASSAIKEIKSPKVVVLEPGETFEYSV